MVTVAKITTLEELVKLWPRLSLLSHDSNPPIKTETALKIFLDCFANGLVFAVRSTPGLVGSCCLHFSDDPRTLILRSLPKDNGEALGKTCLDYVTEWAKTNGFGRIIVTTHKLNGSSYRYFEKSLGFRQQSITFVKNLY